MDIVVAKPAGKEPPTPAPKKIKVLLLKAVDSSYREILERANLDQVTKELSRQYNSWIIEPLWDFLKKTYPDVEYICVVYDGYLEEIK